MNMYIKNLSKSYGENFVLKNISTEIGNGIYGFLGANGVGKSTLFNIISGYIKATSGEISFNGEKPRVGFLPQQFEGYPEMTVQEFLQYMGFVKMGKEYKGILSDINKQLKVFELEDKKKVKLKNLSGGQVRRVGLAQAFLADPHLILLDEPTAGLDPSQRNYFKNYLVEKSQEKTILLSTHIVSDLEFITKKLYVLKNGSFVMEGKEEELISRVDGNVWEVKINKQDVYTKLKHITISESYEQEDYYVIRYINSKDIIEGSKQVKPTLNDVYLYNFKEEGFTNEI
ncbi:MAG: ATP-binding cassette domain-containing protein [Peptostreptococcus porci]|uniref:ABC transporter ATP-binding protein n=1 Tax=Peptostreptococcus porci TaxID=2652282 RepID=UPI002A74BF5F|nr:ATP-binding cassette domain-containing protein [Peptostreptococcus porci]MDY2795140.1 ATP-binding cassette domain-containing protein [Peptostreptococcus porci]MDY5479391.1 ATP-binding cassette domain-containing protein [Peptostreptococcus porci]